MAAQELGLKTGLDIIRRSLPELVYLYASYFRRNGRKFRAISEGPTLFQRVALTAAVALVCVLTSYAAILLDPAKDFPGLMSAEQRAIWAALVPVIAAFPAYWLLQRYSKEPLFFTFLNLGFVTSSALMLIPAIIGLAGFHASSLSTDYANLRAGRGEGTGIHEFICGGLESQADGLALLNQQERIGPELQVALSGMPGGRQEMYASQRKTEALAKELRRAGGPSPANDVPMAQYMGALRERLEITRREVTRTNEVNRLMKANIALTQRSIDLMDHQAGALWRFAKAYPVATSFVAVAWLVGILLWLFAAVICWALVVRDQRSKWRRRLAGFTVVALFLTTMAGFALLRSGMLEALVQETPTSSALQAQLQDRYQLVEAMCPRLYNAGLW